MRGLHYHTINDLLKECLLILMASKEFSRFRLVGGTGLSLQLGHRISVDIDLFTDAEYGSIGFDVLEYFLKANFPYVVPFSNLAPALGKSYAIGTDKKHTIKLDVFYTDPYIQPPLVVDSIRLATIEEIIAMKMDVIQRGGRKKDFWDLHELLPLYPLQTMLTLHQQRYEYTHDKAKLLNNLTNFELADDDFEPICLRGKIWEFIKEDIQKSVSVYKG